MNPPSPAIDSIAPLDDVAGELAWSPDGNEIAIIEVEPGDGTYITRLFIITAATGARRLLAEVAGAGSGLWHSANLFSVCWLPGGQKLVFNAIMPGPAGSVARSSLHVINADGTGLTRLTTREDAFDHNVSCAG